MAIGKPQITLNLYSTTKDYLIPIQTLNALTLLYYLFLLKLYLVVFIAITRVTNANTLPSLDFLKSRPIPALFVYLFYPNP